MDSIENQIDIPHSRARYIFILSCIIVCLKDLAAGEAEGRM